MLWLSYSSYRLFSLQVCWLLKISRLFFQFIAVMIWFDCVAFVIALVLVWLSMWLWYLITEFCWCSFLECFTNVHVWLFATVSWYETHDDDFYGCFCFSRICHFLLVVGSVAQWLGCRSMASRLSLPCTQFMSDSVGELSTVGQQTRPTQPSFPPASVNESLSMYLHG